MEIKIEKATLADAPVIALMAEKLHEENNEPLTEEFKASLMKGIIDAIMSSAKTLLVASIVKRGKRKVIGMGGVVLQPHPIDKIAAFGDYLYVDPKYRNGKVSHDLLIIGEDIARNEGATKLYVEAKAGVKGLLEKTGYKVENIIMSKSLIDEKVSTDGKDDR